MMLLPKDIAADAVESSSAAALAIAAADRIPCGRDAVAAADAAESSDEYPPREPPSFAARTPPCDSVVTIDPTALSPASATTPSLMAAAADVIINPTALLSASAAPPSLLLSFMHRRANFCTCFHHDSAGRCCLCSFADAASDATTAAGRFPCWHDAVSAADTMRPRCGCRRPCRRVLFRVLLRVLRRFNQSASVFCRSNTHSRCCCRCHHRPHRSFTRLWPRRMLLLAPAAYDSTAITPSRFCFDEGLKRCLVLLRCSCCLPLCCHHCYR